MSASDKKKLRKEQESAALTEKQLAQKKADKQLKNYTLTFIVVMVLVVAIAVGSMGIGWYNNSGIPARGTVAVTIGDTTMSNVDLNYYFIDYINNFYGDAYDQYGSYASLYISATMGLDMTQPLSAQIYNTTTGETWADYFVDCAINSAKSTYALYDKAMSGGEYELPEDFETQVNASLASTKALAGYYGFSSMEAYIKAMYGNGASEEGYRDYVEKSILADSYYAAYANTLSYEDSQLREKEAENYNMYSAFDYNSYYISTSDYLEGGTTDENGATTYSDAEKEAAAAKAKEAAETLASGTYATAAEFDAAVAEMKEGAVSSNYDDHAYSSITSLISEWLSSASRKTGDVAALESSSTTTGEDDTETTTVNGYYVVYYRGTNDNAFALKDARHILVAFEGGTTDESTGLTTYSDEEKAAAKTAAEELLAQWKSGEATEDSFAALANEQSDDGDGTTGGLYVNIYPNEMVAPFEDWCYDDSRKAGDTGIIETEYGYHVMYFVGNSDMTYRDYQIQQQLLSEDVSNWYTALVEASPITDGNTSRINTGIILSNS